MHTTVIHFSLFFFFELLLLNFHRSQVLVIGRLFSLFYLYAHADTISRTTMGGRLSAGAIVGIVFGSFGFLLLFAGCVLLNTILNRRRRVRRAVNAASSTAAPAADATTLTIAARLQAFRSRYPEAIPCDNYDELFPDEEPVCGNVVFRSRADIDRMRDVLVRVEDAGDDRSSEDFSTIEMMSVNNSFAHRTAAAIHVGQAMRETQKPHLTLTPASMGSFDNEHNFTMSLVSVYPTPASSMLALAARSQGTLPSASFSHSAAGSYGATFGTPPAARTEDGAVAAAAMTSAHVQGRSRDGFRLLMPMRERYGFDDNLSRSQLERSTTEYDRPKMEVRQAPLFARSEGELRACHAVLGGTTAAPSFPPTVSVPHRESLAYADAASASFQARTDASAASFGNHRNCTALNVQDGLQDRRCPSVKLRPPALPLGLADQPSGSVPTTLSTHPNHSTSSAAAVTAVRSGFLGPIRQHDSLSMNHAALISLKRHKLRIHRHHRVRRVDKGGYVVLEETGSSEGESTGRRASPTADQEASPPQQQQSEVGESGDAGGGSGAQSPAPPCSTGASLGGASPSSAFPNTATRAGTAKAKEKKRYYFEKLSSLDLYGRGHYWTSATSGYPLKEADAASSHSGSDWEPEVGSDGQVLSAGMQHPPHMRALAYMSNSSRKSI